MNFTRYPLRWEETKVAFEWLFVKIIQSTGMSLFASNYDSFAEFIVIAWAWPFAAIMSLIALAMAIFKRGRESSRTTAIGSMIFCAIISLAVALGLLFRSQPADLTWLAFAMAPFAIALVSFFLARQRVATEINHQLPRPLK